MGAKKRNGYRYRGHVEKGAIVLDEPVQLPDGSQVEVVPVKSLAERLKRVIGKAKGWPAEGATVEVRTLAERYKAIIGIAKGLPPDLAKNHDHYLYGTPKKK